MAGAVDQSTFIPWSCWCFWPCSQGHVSSRSSVSICSLPSSPSSDSSSAYSPSSIATMSGVWESDPAQESASARACACAGDAKGKCMLLPKFAFVFAFTPSERGGETLSSASPSVSSRSTISICSPASSKDSASPRPSDPPQLNPSSLSASPSWPWPCSLSQNTTSCRTSVRCGLQRFRLENPQRSAQRHADEMG